MSAPIRPTDAELQRAAQRLRDGLLVAFPTETVYGLGGAASNPAALRRIFVAKDRPADHPVIVHVRGFAHLTEWAAQVPAAAQALADAFWPGPLTLVLPRRAQVSDLITGGQDTVGLRCPAHPVARDLLAAFDGALAAPSANRYGHVSPTRAQHVRDEFAEGDVMVLDGGDCPLGIESTIVGFSDGRPYVLRPGSVTAQQICAAVGQTLAAAPGSAPRVPGSVARHYAPRTAAEWVPCGALTVRAAELRGQGVASVALPCDDTTDLGAQRYAQQLYARLRELDAQGAERILIETVPDSSAWDAVRDRLSRAVSN